MTNGFTYLNFLNAACEIVSRGAFRAAWLKSPHFFSDLELMYSLHLLTTQEWKTHLKVVHHPLLTKSYASKIKYEKQFSVIQEALDKQQKLLIRITEFLMDSEPCYFNNQEVIPYEIFLEFLARLT